MSLRLRLALTFGVLVAIAMLAATLIIGELAVGRVRTDIARQMADIAFQTGDKLDRGMFERWRDVQVAASLNSIFKVGAEETRQRRWLDRLKQTFPSYAWIGFADPAGRVAVSADGLLEGADVSQRPWFAATRDRGAYAGDVHEAKLLQRELGSPGGEPLRFVDVAAAVYDETGAVQGVLGAHLSWTWAEEVTRSVLGAAGERSGVQVLVLSQGGTVLLGPEGFVGQDLALTPGADGVPGVDWPDGKAGDFLIGVSKSQGYRDYPGVGWWIVARQPAAVALAPVYHLQRLVAYAGGAITLLAVLMAWYAAARLAAPIERLTDAAERLRLQPVPGAPGTDTADSRDPLVTLPAVTGDREIVSLADSLRTAFATVRDQARDLAQANATLEKRVEDRTAALAAANIRLMDDQIRLEGQATALTALAEERDRARAVAQAANQAKSNFLAVMSHEVRTPLNGILGVAQLLLAGPLPDDVRPQVRTLQQSGQALLTIVNDILDVSKIEAGKLVLEDLAFSLEDLLDGVRRLMLPGASQKGLALTVALDPALGPAYRGDPARLRQVLLNLVGNALRFTDHGGVTISVAPAEAAGAGEVLSLRFCVTDTGVGLSPAQAGRLFERYVQADETISRRYGGTGLGLAICRDLVDLMGGRIGVDSREGAGSRFWFTIPLIPASAEPVALPVALDAAAAPALTVDAPTFGDGPATPVGTEGGSGARLLLVEDNVVNQQVALALLRRAGHTVRLARDGQEALEILAAEPFDLVLMDMQMPVMNGLETTRRLRAAEAGTGRRMPIIALTAHSLSDRADDHLAAGMDDHLVKPFDHGQLLNRVAFWLARDMAAPREMAPPPPPPAPSGQPADGPVFDPAVLGRLAALVPTAQFHILLREMLGNGLARVDRIAALAQAGDLAGLAREAHDLVATAGSAGLCRLQALGRALDGACAQGDLDGARLLAGTVAAVGAGDWRRLMELAPDALVP
ncbi:hybrid sensor histidine kinase/response regulator [Nitrospirillum iridis]|uniref:Sensory/regulatory protein RpfC n=1 Tax=Nitrospirillum iridis TaxID=765888 RepID=A0A7X0B278_9PROT|nr:hybrid sensor histidine kinase/response regulator [Nitrospirillum iridis]MBB6254388.1 signal transduction histidine kinase/CheY-like chemotaxis protein [Nitrospirillum iridis]